MIANDECSVSRTGPHPIDPAIVRPLVARSHRPGSPPDKHFPSVDRRNPLLLGTNDMLSESEGGLDRSVARFESPTWAAHRAFGSVVPYVRLSHLVTDEAVLARDAGRFRPIQPSQQ